MSEAVNIPQLRFPGFSGEWEEKPYGENYRFLTTNSFSRDKLNYDFGEVKNIHYGDIHTKFKRLFDMSIETVPFINDDVDISGIDNDNYCQVGDLIVADASEDYDDIGKTIEIVNLDLKKTLAGLHTFLARPMGNSISIGFMGNLLKSWKVRKQVMTVAQGSKVLGLSKTNLSKIKISLPTKPEQTKIASFLTAVDNKIEQLSKKQELLGEYKKGLMQQIFSQAIRFKADGGSDFPDWEQVKLVTLSKLVTKQTGYDYSSTIKPSLETSKDDSNIPFVQNKDFNSTSINLNTDFYIPVSVQKKYSRITLDEKCLLITISGNIGNVGVYNKQEKAFIGGAVCVAKFKDKDNIDFVKYYLTTDIGQKMMLREVKASSHQNITVEGIRNFRIMLPYLEEQKKIVAFLSIIDNKIEQAGKQLDESKQFKKALLQQMFV